MTSRELKQLNKTIAPALKNFLPPEDLTVSEWADKYRILSAESSAESGPWHTSRTPYLKDVMDAFTDPMIQRLVLVSSSQVGKSEIILNFLGYIIDQDPGSTLYIQPTVDDCKKFSRQRVTPMLRDCKKVKAKVHEAKSRDAKNTVLQKTFPGGVFTMVGTNSPSGLASTPVRYVLADERDRFAASAGTEGDPFELALARQTTYYNRKTVEVSTPTIKDQSPIAASYDLGTRERWCHQCPHCGEYEQIRFDNIKFKPLQEIKNGKKEWNVENIEYCCPHCGALTDEKTMRRQPTKWIAQNPDAYARGIRSFWINGFSSPWQSWEKIILKFLYAKEDPQKLQVVFNTCFGELWEDRGSLATEDEMLKRREEYAAEVPDGVLVLTCGVDTQDNRLEYEVVGWGRYGESWGIYKGYIFGRPDDPEVWARLDEVLERTYKFKDGTGIVISVCCIDSGVHFTQEVYTETRKRFSRGVVAIKGKGEQGRPFISPPNKVAINKNKKITCWLFTLGVNAGKASIMQALKTETPGARYCHFPLGEDRGYNIEFFNGLLSEREVIRGNSIKWEKLPGHRRNEALDCRNYALAALKIANPDFDAAEKRLFERKQQKKEEEKKPAPRPKKRKDDFSYSDW